MLPEPIAVTVKVTEALEKLGVPHFISGSLASTLYGMVRSAQDADIVADMHADQIQPFADALQHEFFMNKKMMAKAIKRNSSFNIIHRETMFKVDVFIPRPRPFPPISTEASPKTDLPGRPRSERQIFQRGRHHPFQIGMVPAERRGLRQALAGRARRAENKGGGARPGLFAQMGQGA